MKLSLTNLIAAAMIIMGNILAERSLAQNTASMERKVNFGLSVEAESPLGDFHGNHKSGLGGNIIAAYIIQKEGWLTLSAGYVHFRGRSFEDEYLIYKIDDWEAVPVRLGGKYFATRHFFIKAEAGAVFLLEPGSGTSLILSPGAGLQLGHFEAAVKLETWTDGGTISFAGLNLGYFF